MQLKSRSLALVVLAVFVSLASPAAQSPTAPKVTSPKVFFGHDIGADYVLPNYTKFTEYVKKLDAESDRMIVQSIGKTAEGRDQLMAIITAPENFKKLDRYKEISERHGLEISESRVRRAVERASEEEPEQASAWRRVLEQTTAALLRGEAS